MTSSPDLLSDIPDHYYSLTLTTSALFTLAPNLLTY